MYFFSICVFLFLNSLFLFNFLFSYFFAFVQIGIAPFQEINRNSNAIWSNYLLNLNEGSQEIEFLLVDFIGLGGTVCQLGRFCSKTTPRRTNGDVC
ncbi:unnamed protein product [Meloidogyne enterolobii]|uniref:Uncharacterized protein n=1 Tax=Meloidogyne enterolobii TaxID=390850 RepID=A0ACB1AW15_MELEN